MTMPVVSVPSIDAVKLDEYNPIEPDRCTPPMCALIVGFSQTVSPG